MQLYLSCVKMYNDLILTTSLITEYWHTSKKTKNKNNYCGCYWLEFTESKLLILKALPCLVQRFLPPSPSKHLDRVITYNRTFGRCILSPNTTMVSLLFACSSSGLSLYASFSFNLKSYETDRKRCKKLDPLIKLNLRHNGSSNCYKNSLRLQVLTLQSNDLIL